MKRPKLTRLELLLFATPLFSLLVWVLLSTNLVAPLSWRYRSLDRAGQMRSISCYNNLKQLGLAISMYTNDFDKVFPMAKIAGVQSSVVWPDAIDPYIPLKMRSMYTCPTVNYLNPNTPNRGTVTDYWFNGNLSAYSFSKLLRGKAILLLGDGGDGSETIDSSYSKTSLPPNWLADFSAPCYRHLGGANYLFADGHVKWIRPREISISPGAKYTFSVQ